MQILTINSGSSSLKFSIYRLENHSEKLERKGEVADIGEESGYFVITDGQGNNLEKREIAIKSHDDALTKLFEWLRKDSPEESPAGVGHRVVHGGADFREPTLMNGKMVEKLEKLSTLAPEHLPHEIKAIKIIKEKYPELKQVACFDTAFHQNMPIVSKRYPLPEKYWQEGIKRYGFHGLSYEYILQELEKETGRDIINERIIIAHLGNGASMAAVRDGKSYDTTMGFTPAGGLMMGTRSGDLDPGVVIYLMNEKGLNISDINKLINEKAGLLGISGSSPDMKVLLSDQGNNSKLAVEMFCHYARKYLGALAGAMGGLDTLIFTAGIGENSPEIRKRISKNFDYMGLKLDDKRNDNNEKIISTDDSKTTVRVMETNEELMIARHARNIINHI